MDVRAVHAETAAAVERARAGGGPAFLEFRTARYSVHNIATGGRMRDNRPEGALAEARGRDPIERLAAEIDRAAGWEPGGGGREAVDDEIEREIEGAVGFARNSPRPRAGTALDYMYADTYPGFPAPGWEH